VHPMRLTATRLRVDHHEDEPDVTAGDVEIARNDRASWALTIVTGEPWHYGHGECRLLIEVDRNQRFQGSAVLIRSDRGRWHYFRGAGNLGRIVLYDDVT
jgi:hypothetical protein